MKTKNSNKPKLNNNAGPVMLPEPDTINSGSMELRHRGHIVSPSSMQIGYNLYNNSFIPQCLFK